MLTVQRSTCISIEHLVMALVFRFVFNQRPSSFEASKSGLTSFGLRSVICFAAKLDVMFSTGCGLITSVIQGEVFTQEITASPALVLKQMELREYEKPLHYHYLYPRLCETILHNIRETPCASRCSAVR